MTVRTASDRDEIARTLIRMPLFQTLAPEALDALAEQVWVQTYRRCAPIPLAPEMVYIVARGGVRLYRVDGAGHALTLQTLCAGEAFATLAGHLAQACAAATRVYILPRATLFRLQKTHPAFALTTSRLLYRQLTAAFVRMEDLALGSIAVRLARVLVRLAQDHPKQRVVLSHQGLAELIGTRPEQVTKTVCTFRRQGLITTQSAQPGILVRDPAALLALAEAPCMPRPRDSKPLSFDRGFSAPSSVE